VDKICLVSTDDEHLGFQVRDLDMTDTFTDSNLLNCAVA